MNRAFVNTMFILLLVALTIMAVTGLMFIFEAGSHFAGGLHKITGLIFVGLLIIHLIMFRKMLCSYMCTKKSE